MKKLTSLATALLALSATTLPARSHEQHGHQTYSAGEPGDPKKSSRTIEIAMSEMTYEP